MIENNLKLNDSFLVTVEILSANAIIVSATINSVIYRGALIQCKTSVPFIFNNQTDNDHCFSSKRLNVREVKRNVRLKSFKSNYNLRRTNHKIIKAKQIVCKSEPRVIIEDCSRANNNLTLMKPLSIVLKKHNGVYKNIHNLENEENKIEINENNKINSPEFEHLRREKNQRNIIKIRKVKLQSDEYQYSIFTDNIPLISSSLSPVNNDNNNHSQADFSLPQLFAAPSQSLDFDFSKSVKFDSSIYFNSSSDLIIDNNAPLLPNSDDDSATQKILSDTTATITTTTANCNNISKLKIIKNMCNKYVIKPDAVVTRYNCKNFQKDDIIWAKLAGYSIWPAKVLSSDVEDDHVTVLWLGNDQRTSRLPRRKLWDFGAHFNEKFNKKAKGNYLEAVQQAQQLYRKLDFPELCKCHRSADLSSESSTLDSVNIDSSSSYESSSCHDLRTNVYLPAPDEEFELARPPMQPNSSASRPSLTSRDKVTSLSDMNII